MIGERISLTQIERVASSFLVAEGARRSVRRPEARPEIGTSGVKPKWASVYAGCDAIRAASSVTEGLPEPVWYAVASVAVHCEGGRDDFHRISESDARYSASETDRKLDQASSASPPRLCESFQSLGSDCSKCPFAGRINSPIALGYSDPVVAELSRRWVYVADRDGFLDIETIATYPALLPRRAFDAMHRHRLAGASEKLLSFKHGARVHRLSYLPGRALIVGESLNLWQPPTLRPQRGDWPNIALLLQTVLPIEAERDHLLNALAYLVKDPGAKVGHAFMIRGVQGSGKNSLFSHVLAAVFGSVNLRVISGQALLSRFDSELVNLMVLVIDEVVHRDGWTISNALKPLISEDAILAEAKGESRRLATTPRMIFILSNDRTPLPMDATDRRFFVPAYGEEKLSSDAYSTLYAGLGGELPGFLDALLSRDTSAFNPKAPPPHTAAKAELQATVRPPLERQIREMIEDRRGAFAVDIVLPQAVLTELRLAGHTLVTEQAVAKALRDAGAVSLGQLPAAPKWSGRPRCWAVRRQEELSRAGPAAWARILSAGCSAHSAHRAQPVPLQLGATV